MLRNFIHQVVHRTPAVAFTSDDLYRICALVNSSKDPLGLKEEHAFLSHLASQYRAEESSTAATSAPLTPFQKSMVQEVLRPYFHVSDSSTTIAPTAAAMTSSSALGTGTLGESKEQSENGGEGARDTTASSSTPSLSDLTLSTPMSGVSRGAVGSRGVMDNEPNNLTALECLTAMWSLVDEAQAEKSDFTGDRLLTFEKYMKEMETKLRQLTPTETASLAKALSSVHYRNYQHVTLVSRRSCEVASQLDHKDACQLYHNIIKLQCLDSLMPLVQRILSFEGDLNINEVRLLAQALEKQQSTSFAGGKLLGGVLNRAQAIISHATSPTIHRSLLAATARFNFTRNSAIQPILQDLSRFKKKDAYHFKDVSALLRSMNTLGVAAGHPAYAFLVDCVKDSVPTTLQVRQIDTIMDILSEVPVDSTETMNLLMNRLEKDAGKLGIPQLMNVLQLLSSYPPAKGHICVVSLSFAASMRGESIEAGVLEDILVSLSQLQHFTDDFFNLVRVLFKKGGFKKFETLETILSQCPAAVLQSDEGAELAKNGILQLAPILNDQELQQCRKLLLDKGIDDKVVQQRIMNRAKQLQRGGGDGYNPYGGSGGRGGGFSGGRGGAARHGGGNRGKRRHYDPMDDLIQ